VGAWGIDTQWARMLAYITGLVDQELLVRTEYLAAENRILRAQLKGRLRLSDAERATLGEIGHRLGRKALAEVANAALPDTILGWYQKLVARKFDGSKARRGAGRPRADSELERLIVKMARENPGWGCDRIVGALANLGHEISDQTVGNILKTPRGVHRTGAETHDQLGRLYSSPHGSASRNGLFQRGGFNAAWVGDLLRAVLHTFREPQG